MKHIVLVAVLLLVMGCSVEQEEKTSKENNETISENTNLIAGQTTKLYEFDVETFAQAQQSNKTILLYFYSNWCDVCNQEINEFVQAVNLIGDSNLVFFRVNFRDSDTEPDETKLATVYNVTRHQTKVFFNTNQSSTTQYWTAPEIVERFT